MSLKRVSKIKLLEDVILKTLDRATQPNTGWDVYQKIKTQVSTHGEEVCNIMKNLSDRGLLDITGNNIDNGYYYEKK